MKEEIEIGDLVRIKDGTHDPRMPDGRVGIVAKGVFTKKTTASGYPMQPTLVFEVLFTNGECLNFHKMWLERISAA